MEPPLSNTTRMIANSSTTDSEMATTDHTLGRSALPARGRNPAHPARTIVPPTRPGYAAGDASTTSRVSGRVRAARGQGPNGRDSYDNSTGHPHREFDRIVSVSTQRVRS
ncbi:hypothetical protein GCM10010320_04370 [Streptomyces caelestis]|nr:hypothetical protein GCM10010320_04370 [Streptomyces caelestis]